jgi:hypothetical protein
VVRGGHASLVLAQVSGAHVTSRIEALAGHRLKGLSVRARRFVRTASILGSSARLEDVGEMLLLASALIYLRRLDEATAITNSVESVEGAAHASDVARRNPESGHRGYRRPRRRRSSRPRQRTLPGCVM